MTSEITPLWRPVGLYELVRVIEAGYRAFPPRLVEQPIFYPVLNRPYAEQIAREWNPGDPNSGYSGFVTQFGVSAAIAAKYPRRVVGGGQHEELWVPAEEQTTLEQAFNGQIEVVVAWLGPQFAEALPQWSGPLGRVEGASLGRLLDAVAAGPVVGGPRTTGPS